MLLHYVLFVSLVPLLQSFVRFDLIQYGRPRIQYNTKSMVRLFSTNIQNVLNGESLSFKDIIRISKSRRDFRYALEIADRMAADLHSISAANITGVIQVYGEAGKLGDALNILRKMEQTNISPNEYHMSALIQACRKVGQWEMALGLYERLPMYGLKENHVISNCILSTLIEAAQYTLAYEIFDRMKTLGIHTVFSYSILMSAFESEGKWEKAIEVYESMGRENIQPNNVIFNSVLKACLRHGQFQKVVDLFHKYSQQVLPDAITYSLVISALGQLGDFDAAYKLFRSVTEPNSEVKVGRSSSPVTVRVDTGVYNAMLVVCSKLGRWQECLAIMSHLNQQSTVRADAKSFATAITCCGKMLRWREALDLYHQLDATGIKLLLVLLSFFAFSI